MKNNSVSQHAFSLVPKLSKPRSVFNRPHSYKTTFDTDYLIPFYCSNILPGDTVKVRHSALIRLLSPSIRPFMDNLHFDWFYFYVPYRLLWTNFVKFMGEQSSPADSISYTVPQCTGPNVAGGGITVHSLHDYLGIPVGPLSGGGGTTGITFNNLIPRAYNKIYMDWFKDQNLQNAVTLDLGDGPDTYTNYVLLKRGKRHDYFTSALPFLQKGTAVSLSLGSTAPVLGDGSTPIQLTGVTSGTDSNLRGDAAGTTVTLSPGVGAGPQNVRFKGGNFAGLYADLTNATASTINTLRQSVALQQFLENDARGGTRYTEIVRQRWGVTSPDARLNRVELLSLGSAPIKVNPVAQSSDQFAANAQGNLAAFATGADVGNGFSKSFTEHGCIIGLCMVRADLSYQQGLDRHWSYRTRYDFFNPEFANLGEQTILNKEIYANVPDGTSSTQKDGAFGYQERYAEERFSKSLITGQLRSGVASSLDVWHLAQQFSALPTLGSTFISEASPLDRNVAVPAYPHFILDTYFDETWARVIPMFSVPGLNKL